MMTRSLVYVATAIAANVMIAMVPGKLIIVVNYTQRGTAAFFFCEDSLEIFIHIENGSNIIRLTVY